MIQEVTSPEMIATTVELARKIWNHHYIPIIGQAQVDYMLAKFQSQQAITAQIEQGYCYYMVTKDGKALGYTAVKDQDNKLMLSKLYVLSTERGAGLGLALLAHCKEVALKKNCHSIWLTVNRHNAGSIGWYRKKGFKIKEEKKFDIGNGYVMDDYILEVSCDDLLV